MAQKALIGTRPVADPALKIAEISSSGDDTFRFVLDENVDHTVGRLDLNRADVLRPEHAESTTLDHGRSTHADIRRPVGDYDIAASEQRGVTGKAPARNDAHERHLAINGP